MQVTAVVVDDNEPLADTYAELLPDEYAVETAYTAEEALGVVADADVVVLDRELPGMSGDELLDEIRERDHDCGVVVVSGKRLDFEIVDLPFDDYLVKPVGGDELRDAVARARRRRECGVVAPVLERKAELLEARKDEDELAESAAYGDLRDRIGRLDESGSTTGAADASSAGDAGDAADASPAGGAVDASPVGGAVDASPVGDTVGGRRDDSAGRRDGSSDSVGGFDGEEDRRLPDGGKASAERRTAPDELEPWKFREAVDNAGHAILFTDLDGTIQYVNPAFERLTGYDPEEAIGEDPSLLQSGEHDDEFYSDLWETISSGEVWEGELVNERKDGERHVIEQTIAPIPRDGQYRGYVAINTDITEKRERERKIEALHSATRDLLEADTVEAVATEVGHAVQAVLDFPINVVRVRKGGQLCPVHVDDRTRELLGERPAYDVDDSRPGRALDRGEPLVFDDVCELDGETDQHPVRSWLYVPLGEYGVVSVGQTEPNAFDDAEVNLVQILANNAETALVSLEHERELERENERLERFASTVSHDLRNPLNVAEGTLDQMREFTDQLERMTRAHERMEEVIEGVLTLARQGERVQDTERVPLDSVSRRCWSHVSTEGTDLAVETESDEAWESVEIEANEARLKHLFENLFRNAVTHGNASTVRVGSLENGGFYVADDGDGISEEERDRVFETGYTTANDGTGLGLAIVHEIADAHGWRATLSESRDGGARFEFVPAESSYGK